jgi:hypothetical protein
VTENEIDDVISTFISNYKNQMGNKSMVDAGMKTYKDFHSRGMITGTCEDCRFNGYCDNYISKGICGIETIKYCSLWEAK